MSTGAQAVRERIAQQQAAAVRQAAETPKERKWRRLWEKAHAAGIKAGEAARPTPMVVIERADPFDDTSRVVRRYAPIEGGVCGFAWVNVPGNSGFGRWAIRKGPGSRAYGGGVNLRIREFGQSLERKEAAARAAADVLRAAGIRAYAESRMD